MKYIVFYFKRFILMPICLLFALPIMFIIGGIDGIKYDFIDFCKDAIYYIKTGRIGF